MGNDLNSRPRNQIHDILLIHFYNVTRIIVYRSFHYFINRYDFFFCFSKKNLYIIIIQRFLVSNIVICIYHGATIKIELYSFSHIFMETRIKTNLLVTYPGCPRVRNIIDTNNYFEIILDQLYFMKHNMIHNCESSMICTYCHIVDINNTCFYFESIISEANFYRVLKNAPTLIFSFREIERFTSESLCHRFTYFSVSFIHRYI